MVQHSFCKRCAPLVETRRMIVSCENRTLGQGHDLTGKGDFAYQSIRIISLNTSNTSKVFLIFHCFSMSIKSYCKKTAEHFSVASNRN